MSLHEDFNEFARWYKRRIGDNPSKVWFDIVQKNHSEIRKKIGGITICEKINLENSYEITNLEEMNSIIDSISTYAPNYLKTYNLNKKDLLNPILFDKIKTTKHLLTYANKHLNPFIVPVVASIASSLGKEYKNNTGTERFLYLTLSTSTKSFVNLGHYFADRGSCFSDDGSRWKHKYRLAVCKNSYVLLISTQPKKNEIQKIRDNKVRMWGFSNDDLSEYSFCNLYQKGDISEIDIKNSIRKLCSKVLKIDNLHEQENKVNIDSGYIYHNDDVDWTFFDKTKPPKKLFAQLVQPEEYLEEIDENEH